MGASNQPEPKKQQTLDPVITELALRLWLQPIYGSVLASLKLRLCNVHASCVEDSGKVCHVKNTKWSGICALYFHAALACNHTSCTS